MRKLPTILACCALAAFAPAQESEIEDFEFDVVTIDGEHMTQDTVRDKVLIVDLWGTWCGPCKRAIPHLERIYQKYKPHGLVILGLSYERTEDTARAKALVEAYAKRAGVSYPLALGSESVKKQVPNFKGYPTMLFFKRGLRFSHLEVGFTDEHAERIESWVEAAVADKSKKPAKPVAIQRTFECVGGQRVEIGDGKHSTLIVLVHPKARPNAALLARIDKIAAANADKLAVHVVTREDIAAKQGELKMRTKDLALLRLGKAFPAYVLRKSDGSFAYRDAGNGAAVGKQLIAKLEEVLAAKKSKPAKKRPKK